MRFLERWTEAEKARRRGEVGRPQARALHRLIARLGSGSVIAVAFTLTRGLGLQDLAASTVTSIGAAPACG